MATRQRDGHSTSMTANQPAGRHNAWGAQLTCRPMEHRSALSHSSAAQSVLAGVVCGVVGFTSSFAVVLQGLRAVGASPRQAASGLLVLCLTMGLGCIIFSWQTRMPITMAWSTPGAALLAAATAPRGGFATAVGAFVLVGLLLALTGLVKPLGDLVARIPTALAQAMLAGVLLVLCIKPFLSLVKHPAAIAPIILVWLVLVALGSRWAVPGALAAALVVMATTGAFSQLTAAAATPVVELVAPRFDLTAIVALGLPLFLVTMTSQNIPGMAVLNSFGYRPDLRVPLAYTGVATTVGAVGGGHAINLSAIAAALAAGPEAGPDPSRRWIAGVTCGITYMLFGPLSGLVAAMAAAAPPGTIETVAGVALIATFAGAASGALSAGPNRDAAAVTVLVSASGLSIAGIGAAFWGLVAGGLYLLATARLRHRRG